MQTKRPVVGLPVALLLCVIAALLTYQVSANRPMAAPAAVGTIDLNRTLERLDEKAQAEARLRDMAARIEVEGKERIERINQAKASLDAAPAAERPALARELELQLIQTRAWEESQKQQVDIEMSLMLREIYRNIREQTAAMAAAQGLDLVIVDDSSGDIVIDPRSRLRRESQVRQQIIGRRMLYRSDSVDLTDALVDRMNNAFRAGGGNAGQP